MPEFHLKEFRADVVATARRGEASACDRTVWRLFRDGRWWSVFVRRKGTRAPGAARTQPTVAHGHHRARRQARLGRLTPIGYEAIITTQVALAA
ncbi:hypothetical protein ABE437_04820 [Isoptericola cucumis]|uniref:hypothetical protein n=1 Tax=Isoptericola cucumis TaxID=1776856 RepID=UPI003209F18A